MVPASTIIAAGLKSITIGIHANQHLRRSLPTDPAIHIRLAGKVLVQSPEVRNRVPHEYDSLRICRLLRQVFVGLMIAAELVPILKLIGKTTRAVEKAAVRARRVEVIRQLAFRAGGNQQKADREKKAISSHRRTCLYRFPY
ncbi:MAG TPA: hypothetical protein VMD76_06305 [Candidatus Sulfotelmatobacter sp.]|nr:hypothetical protein [Candidatus Sulfotelmatobacter sp.]